MDDQYGLSGIHHYRPHFSSTPPVGDPFSATRLFTNAGAELAPPLLGFGSYRSSDQFESVAANGGGSSGGGVTPVTDGGRWPRQETLMLLEIRTRLNSRFKEANQKGQLWDEVSRIMSDEHGYQRSGKKCREKFENLYKYYKKTKEGKAGRQDGKNYRFFRQLEALYGDHTNQVSLSRKTDQMGYNFDFHYVNNNTQMVQATQEPLRAPKLCDSLSLCNSSEFDTSSSEDNGIDGVGSIDTGSTGKKQKRRGRRSWKTKIKDFIDSQMRKVMERQEEWMEKTTKILERKEQERAIREEESRKQEAERVDREHKFWANERAWIEARDAAFMEALHKITGKGVEQGVENASETVLPYSWNGESSSWGENEISRLIQLRANMDYKFQGGRCSEEAVWEEISGKMACLGHDRRGLVCKEKWDGLQNYVKRTNEGYKKRREDHRSCYYVNNGSVYNNHGEGGYGDVSDQGFGASSISDGGFRFMLGNDGENNWENYGVKLGKGPSC